VEREGEVDVWIVLSEAFDAGDDADSGKGKVAGGDGQKIFVGQLVNSSEGILGVTKRFAHAHEDNGVDGEVVLDEVEDLVKDLVGS